MDLTSEGKRTREKSVTTESNKERFKGVLQ
jgi:hypothetical protein